VVIRKIGGIENRLAIQRILTRCVAGCLSAPNKMKFLGLSKRAEDKAKQSYNKIKYRGFAIYSDKSGLLWEIEDDFMWIAGGFRTKKAAQKCVDKMMKK
jgi:hypothetical protein